MELARKDLVRKKKSSCRTIFAPHESMKKQYNSSTRKKIVMKSIKIVYTIAIALMATQCTIAQQSITFEKYMQEVASNNLEYLAEQYNVRIADAEISIRKMLPDPELSLEAMDESFLVELCYKLELGKQKNHINLAKTEAEIEVLTLEWFFNELRQEAAEAYLNAILQRELLKVKRNSYEYVAQLAEYDSLQHKAGKISEHDARQTLLETVTLRNEVYHQEGEYKSAITLLNKYMGNSSGELFDLSGSWDNINKNYNLDELIAHGIKHRIDLLMANKCIKMAYQNIKTVKAERRADIGLMVGYERDWSGPFPVRRDMLKVGIAIPLKLSNLNKGAIRQSKHVLDQHEIQAKNTALQVQTDISQAYFRYESLGKQVEQYNTGLMNEARALLDGMTFRYKRGETNIPEVLAAQRTYNEVIEAYLKSTKEYASALITLQKSSGIWDINF